MIIYKTTNLINGNFYIGLDSKNIPSYLGGGLHLTRAIKKYGKENFKKEILEYCKSINELQEREVFWIDKLNPHYNISKGGYGNANPSDETRKKLSKASSGKNNAMYGMVGKLNPFFGQTHSEETKKEIGDKNRGNTYRLGQKASEETKRKISKNHADFSGPLNPMFGVERHDMRGDKNIAKKPEVRKLISESKKGDLNPVKRPEVREKISKTLKGRIPWNKGKTDIYSEETLKVMSESKKGRIAWNKNKQGSQKTKDKISDTRQKRIASGEITTSDETRKKCQKLAWAEHLEIKDWHISTKKEDLLCTAQDAIAVHQILEGLE